MSVTCKFERSLLSHDEYEVIRITHHPAIYELDGDELHATRLRLRGMRDKERTLARQKRREARGKANPRGRSFPGTAERPQLRKRVFVAALKRVNNEFNRIRRLEARAELAEAARRALALRRGAPAVDHPAAGDTAYGGMRPLPSRRRRFKVHPSRVGSVSKATKVAQAARDSRS